MADLPIEFAEKRRILYGRGQESNQLDVAKNFLAEGRLAEALEFLERNRDPGMLEDVRRAAVERGDAFGFARASQILKADADPDDWRRLSEAAGRRERWFDAIRALQMAGDEEAAEALRLEHHPDYTPFKPAGK